MNSNISALCKLIRYYILTSSTEAGSGHPTSSLSAVELMATLMFGSSPGGGFFHYDGNYPENPNNDRLIFSKGHASPLFYSLWAAAGKVSEPELLTLRKFGSRLEGHPAMKFPYTEVATGSLGQGLSVGVGMALNAKLEKLPYKTYVLLGDSEMAEGSNWEAIQIGAHYKLNNLIGIIDVNRLGQRGETMLGHDVDGYKKRISAFGWNTIVVDGHDIDQIVDAYKTVQTSDVPTMIIAKTVKGKGVFFIEDKNGWHGKVLSRDDLAKALHELGEVDQTVRGELQMPEVRSQLASLRGRSGKSEVSQPQLKNFEYKKGEMIATRKAYGNALVRVGEDLQIVVLDGEVNNSTYSEFFAKKYPQRYFEMFIAEQNMAGAALGFAARGKIPFASTFSAFWSRAFDQIRMSHYSHANIKFCGSHSGVSIGEDGPSQMGLEDIGLFRSLLDSVILYPSDAVSAERIVELALEHKGIVYIRTTRKETPVLYDNDDSFTIGGSKTLKSSDNDQITIAAAGITLHEALAAAENLEKEGVHARVIDLYSVKPLDKKTLLQAANETQAIVTVEDHYPAGGIGEAVAAVLSTHKTPVYSLAVTKSPMSGKPAELLDYEQISASAIVKKVKEILT